MEWVETTAASIEEATAKALDLLNVDSADAEVEILEDVKKNIFGRVKAEARVRARIKPKAPAPKDDRRNRRGSGRSRTDGASSGSSGGSGSGGGNSRSRSGGRNRKGRSGGSDGGSDTQTRSGGRDSGGGNSGGRDSGSGDSGGRSGQKSNDGASKAAAGAAASSDGNSRRRDKSNSDKNNNGQPRGGRKEQEPYVDEEFSVSDQQAVMAEFVGGVAKVFDPGSTVEVVDQGDDTLEAQVSGEDLGLLVGPSGATLTSLEELCRTAMQRAAAGRRYHRIHVDVDGYKERRREALRRFAEGVAETVVDSSSRKALEPMSAADRKVVHDALSEYEGVSTTSEGDDPRRYVVVLPD